MKVTLRNLVSNDREYFYKWIKDKDVIKYSLAIFQKISTDKEISRWFDLVLEDTKAYCLGIVNEQNDKLIGYAGIAGISDIDLSGEYFIFIGNKNYHGNGIGTYVTKEIIKRGFEELKLNRIMLTVAEKNFGAFKAYKKAGFIEEGCLREAFYRNGEFSNKIVMGLVKKEWDLIVHK